MKQIAHILNPQNWWGVRPWKRHSLVLMVAGLVFMAIGSSYIATEPTPGRLRALWVAYQWLPPKAWGVIFILAGIMSFISSRWPPISETWGYMVLTGLSSGWAGCYLFGVIFKHWSDSEWANLSGFLSWGLIAFMWWAISGLVNPTDATSATQQKE